MEYCWNCGAKLQKGDDRFCSACDNRLPSVSLSNAERLASQEQGFSVRANRSPETARDHLRLLAVFVTGGALLFLGVMLALNVLLLRAPVLSDGSIIRFYPVMAGAGALFGFERWWSHEQGPYNPFHD